MRADLWKSAHPVRLTNSNLQISNATTYTPQERQKSINLVDFDVRLLGHFTFTPPT